MGRDKSKDDNYFNCNQEHELNYVSGLYVQKQKVYDFLKESCKNGTIKYMTHKALYQLIKDKLGYEIPN